jgi:hypothetical protein
MSLVKCPGHDFDHYEERLVASGSSIREWWICSKCQLRVKTKYAMEYLTGKTS